MLSMPHIHDEWLTLSLDFRLRTSAWIDESRIFSLRLWTREEFESRFVGAKIC